MNLINVITKCPESELTLGGDQRSFAFVLICHAGLHEMCTSEAVGILDFILFARCLRIHPFQMAYARRRANP